MSLLLLLPLGILAGAVGTLIGTGGGFILLPFLLFLLPQESPGIITGISLAVVLANALSGSIAYARQGRIEYRWAGLLSVTGLLGMVVGAIITENLSRDRFKLVVGSVFLLLAIYLWVRPVRRGAARSLLEARAWHLPLTRRLVLPVAAIGLAKGVFGGLLGVGGGIVLVPILVQVYLFPAHIATATSQLVILLTSPGAIAVHALSVPLVSEAVPILLLAVGAVLGAQAGAWLSQRLSGPWIVRVLALALGAVAVRLLPTAA